MKFSTLIKNLIILEAIDDKLKEDVYKLFKINNFNKKIQISDKQRSIIATKHVVEHLKDYIIIPCEGIYDNTYKYYFPIIELENKRFVVDLGNNIDSIVVPKVLLLDGSEYIIKKEYDKKYFLKNYKKLSNEYNQKKL